jgi:hypothetical protein
MATQTKTSYFRELTDGVGGGWTRFWFTPSDPIVLSLLRMLVGLVALWWYLGLFTDLQHWFGPNGLLSDEFAKQLRIQADEFGQERFAFSIVDLAGSAITLWIIYGIGLIAIVMMIVGLFSRVATIATLIFVLSFIHRAPILVRSVDFVLSVILFYLCIGPNGAYISIDACLRRRRQPVLLAPESRESQFSSAATIAIRLIQVHVVLIFFAMALAQLREDAWWQGTAVWWMMAKSDSRLVDLTGTGRAINALAYEYLINFFTHLIVLYEFAFCFLIWNRLARPILLVLGVFVWLGIALISGSVSFAVLMLIATFAFLSPDFVRGVCDKCWGGREATGDLQTVA